jgi:hypothetical protein
VALGAVLVNRIGGMLNIVLALLNIGLFYRNLLRTQTAMFSLLIFAVMAEGGKVGMEFGWRPNQSIVFTWGLLVA